MRIYREASDLSIPPGVVRQTVEVDGRSYLFDKTLRQSGEVTGWLYKGQPKYDGNGLMLPGEANNSDELVIVND